MGKIGTIVAYPFDLSSPDVHAIELEILDFSWKIYGTYELRIIGFKPDSLYLTRQRRVRYEQRIWLEPDPLSSNNF